MPTTPGQPVRYAEMYWTIEDLDNYDATDEQKTALLNKYAGDLRDLLCERGNNALATFAVMEGLKLLDDEENADGNGPSTD